MDPPLILPPCTPPLRLVHRPARQAHLVLARLARPPPRPLGYEPPANPAVSPPPSAVDQESQRMPFPTHQQRLTPNRGTLRPTYLPPSVLSARLSALIGGSRPAPVRTAHAPVRGLVPPLIMLLLQAGLRSVLRCRRAARNFRGLDWRFRRSASPVIPLTTPGALKAPGVASDPALRRAQRPLQRLLCPTARRLARVVRHLRRCSPPPLPPLLRPRPPHRPPAPPCLAGLENGVVFNVFLNNGFPEGAMEVGFAPAR